MNVEIVNSKTDTKLNSHVTRSATVINYEAKPLMKFSNQKTVINLKGSNHSMQRLKVKKAAPVDNEKKQTMTLQTSKKNQAEKFSKLQSY